jgi:wobble nucleotide-excising tRNase
MIEKIVSIKNIGHFVDYNVCGTKEWNGSLTKVTTIYAPNGSGKTTLSTILKSIKLNKPELIELKKTFGCEEEARVKIKESNHSGLIEYDGASWNYGIPELEVFDINFIEDYLFVGSYTKKQNKDNLFELLLGDKGIELKKKCKPLIHAKENAEKRLKRTSRKDPNYENFKQEFAVVSGNLGRALQQYRKYSKEIFDLHINVVNRFLEKFTNYIKIVDISFQKGISDYETFRIIMTFEVYGEKVQFLAPDIIKMIGNAKFALSEGDKSTIALCFFLARLEIQGIVNKIVVFDDPLSSFDYSRRTTTIYQLSKIANSAEQLIILTHDLNFANEFTDKCSFLDCTNLKIINDGKTSFMTYHDIKSEYLTSTQKDIKTIKKYLICSAVTESEKREVIRCIRPVLEGVIKTKYFDLFEENIWLGELINKIKNSHEPRLSRFNQIIEDISELNDYTKRFHHSSGNAQIDYIEPNELKRYVNLLMKIIDQI